MKLAGLLVGAVWATSIAVPGAHAASDTSFAQFRSLESAARTPSGQLLHLTIAAEREGTDKPVVSISIRRQAKGTMEYHTRSFRISRSSFDYNAPTGHLRTGDQLGRYGRLSLTMTRRDSSSRTCDSVNGGTSRETVVTVSVTASFTFRTLIDGKRSAWGTIQKGPSFDFGEGSNGPDYYPMYTYVTNGMCAPRPPTYSYPSPCMGGWTWDANPLASARPPRVQSELTMPGRRSRTRSTTRRPALCGW